MKIWAKLMKNGRNMKDIIYSNDFELDYETYEIILREITQLLDVSCPITMHTHYNSFNQFNIHKFKAPDFIDTFEYDTLDFERFE